ncbi:Glutathione S-transferase omega-1 [Papilio xuthus]|uniref:Glutathione S-transferase omega-1 n=1 Tax=Papilio xuthus TaxID=66420 RepID=A0A194PWB9_PAPXU|nr:Glutathione S-transferase omega-1 [Papilio xuthus]
MANKAIKGGINFNGKHLRKGDPLPTYNGKLRVYNMRYCPSAQRTILALIAKDIDFEVVNVHLLDKPEWLTRKSAFGKVPSIEIKEDVCIYESLVTVEYLDEVYDQRPLISKDPVTKAYDKIIVEAIGPLQTVFFKFVKAPETITDDNIIAYNNALRYIQDQLKSRGTQFFGGNEPGYADYMIWPWLERLYAVQDTYEAAKFDGAEYKLLNEYVENMLNDPAVKIYLVPKDVLMKVYEGYRTGKVPDYDLLMQ